jgi:hypothetical protein
MPWTMLSRPGGLLLGLRTALSQMIRVRTPMDTRIVWPEIVTTTVASPGATPVTVPVLDTVSTLRSLLVKRAPLTSLKGYMPS